MREETEEKPATERTCVRCARTKPEALFRLCPAGTRTAWCEVCRQEAAKRYKVEEDLVELAHALYVLEITYRNEAKVVAAANVAAGRESQGLLAHLETRIREFERQRLHRIAYHVGRLVMEYRNTFYASVNMAPPEVEIPEPAA